MTGTVHDRAIAAELRAIAGAAEHVAAALSNPSESLNERIGKRFLLRRADQLEAAAPPATIDAGYDGDEPPVATVLVNRGGLLAIRDDGWRLMGYDGWLHNWEAFKTLDRYLNSPWTVLRWGAA